MVALALLYNLLIAAYHLLVPRHISRFRALRARSSPDAVTAPYVSILVPARNEARHVRRCLRSLLAQDYPSDKYEIIFIDDGSTDGTRELLGSIKEGREPWAQPRLRVLQTPPLQPGWTGKSQALWWGAQAVSDRVRWLLFVDADTSLEPTALSTVVREAEARGLHMLSLQPRQELEYWWEKVVLPVSLLQLLKSINLIALNDDNRSNSAAANGQFILIRHDIYILVGTHEAIRSEILESVVLARRVRERGYIVRLENGFRLVRAHSYGTFRTLWETYQKAGVALYQGSLAAVAFSTLAVAFLDLLPFLWPWVALHRGRSRRNFLLLLLASLITPFAVLYQRMRAAHHFGLSRWYAFTHPLGVGATLLITWSALLRLWWRASIPWKGREYQPTDTS